MKQNFYLLYYHQDSVDLKALCIKFNQNNIHNIISIDINQQLALELKEAHARATVAESKEMEISDKYIGSTQEISKLKRNVNEQKNLYEEEVRKSKLKDNEIATLRNELKIGSDYKRQLVDRENSINTLESEIETLKNELKANNILSDSKLLENQLQNQLMILESQLQAQITAKEQLEAQYKQLENENQRLKLSQQTNIPNSQLEKQIQELKNLLEQQRIEHERQKNGLQTELNETIQQLNTLKKEQEIHQSQQTQKPDELQNKSQVDNTIIDLIPHDISRIIAPDGFQEEKPEKKGFAGLFKSAKK